MRLSVRHVTTYHYAKPVSVGQSEAKLRPRATSHQEVLSSTVEISPPVSSRTEFMDYFGNRTDYFGLDSPHRELRVSASSEVIVRARPAPLLALSPAWEKVRDALRDQHAAPPERAYEYVFDTPFVRPSREIRSYAERSFPPGRPLLEATHDLSARIHADFQYESGSTTITTPLKDVMAQRRGVCQDFAHLGIACLRAMGLAARYVSGYLLTRPPPGQPKRLGADASHAWFSVFCPGEGFVDFDPTNGSNPDDSYVTVAFGRDFGDVSPVKGVILGGGAHTVHAAVDVFEQGSAAREGEHEAGGS